MPSLISENIPKQATGRNKMPKPAKMKGGSDSLEQSIKNHLKGEAMPEKFLAGCWVDKKKEI